MPLPLILAIGAAVTTITGVGAGVHGGVKMKKAQDTMNDAKNRHEKNVRRFKTTNDATCRAMDRLGEQELEILSSFDEFSNVWAKIHNKPHFNSFENGHATIAKYTPEEIKNVSVGAGVLLGGLGGAAVGTAGGFAAAGATTAAVMALGTASTGTAIATLSGVAATNATLAALGGGALAAGGGGVALGTTILGASTLGVGLLIGGIIFAASGNAISSKADKAYGQMLESEATINDICSYLDNLVSISQNYREILQKVNLRYLVCFENFKNTVNEKRDWNLFSAAEKLNAENVVSALGLLYEMCKVKIVKAAKYDSRKNEINYMDIMPLTNQATVFLAT